MANRIADQRLPSSPSRLRLLSITRAFFHHDTTRVLSWLHAPAPAQSTPCLDQRHAPMPHQPQRVDRLSGPLMAPRNPFVDNRSRLLGVHEMAGRAAAGRAPEVARSRVTSRLTTTRAIKHALYRHVRKTKIGSLRRTRVNDVHFKMSTVQPTVTACVPVP